MRYILIISVFLFVNSVKSQNTYYVAIWGDDADNGSINTPWETWQKAFEVAEAGDTVYFRGGVYYSLVRNDIDPSRGIGNSGTYSNPIVYMSYPGEWAILDCSRHIETYGFGNGKYNGAISINRAEHLHFKNFEVRNVFQLDSLISGGISASSYRNLAFEHIIMHNIGQRGFYIQGGAWLSHYEDDKAMGSPRNVSYPPWPDYTDTTKFINCDVYNLCDSISRTGGWDPGNGADAWKTIHYRGNYVLWQGCRAWNYTDDGYDPSTINGATRVFDNCWAMASNKYKNSFPGYTMERNGFKIPGSEFYPEHNPEYTILQNCLSLFSVRGLYLLYIEGWGDVNARMYNNTSYANGINYSGGKPTDTFKNNLSYGATALNAFGEPYECASMSNGIIESNNTWDWSSGYPWFTLSKEVTVTDADFVGITGNWVVDSLYLVDLFTAPRQADGSLPAQRPLMLAPTSDLINAGTDIGSAYNGIAPDIGYYENEYNIETGNKYPYILITSPTNRSRFTKPSEIPIQVSASDTDGSIGRIEFFYRDTIRIGDTHNYPWTVTWDSNIPIGRYPLRAVATDNEGDKTTSARVWITVLPDMVNNENKVFLYPNPNDGLFTFLLTEPLKSNSKLRVSDMKGKIIFEDNMQQEQTSKQLNLSFLTPGVYITTLFSNEIILTGKFIKY